MPTLLSFTCFVGHTHEELTGVNSSCRPTARDVSRYRSVDTLQGYVRDAEIFKDHAGAGLL
jgi:hypothetical protein